MLKLWITLSILTGERVESLRHRDDEGATAVEYGLMVALIAVVIIGVVGALGGALQLKFGCVRDAITGAQQNAAC